MGDRIQEFETTDLGERSYGAKRPVFVLTSPNTFSGGEELTYDIQVFKRGVVVGEVTGGGANPTGPVPLVHNFPAIIFQKNIGAFILDKTAETWFRPG